MAGILGLRVPCSAGGVVVVVVVVGTMQGRRLEISICPCWAGDHTTRCSHHHQHYDQYHSHCHLPFSFWGLVVTSTFSAHAQNIVLLIPWKDSQKKGVKECYWWQNFQTSDQQLILVWGSSFKLNDNSKGASSKRYRQGRWYVSWARRVLSVTNVDTNPPANKTLPHQCNCYHINQNPDASITVRAIWI